LGALDVDTPGVDAPGEEDSPYSVRASLKELMWEKIGLRRNGANLAAGLGEIASLGERAARVRAGGGRAYNIAWQNVLDVRNQITVAELIARSAIERDESRGSHYRDDIPESKEDALYNVFISKRSGEAVIERRPVRFTRVKPGGEIASAAEPVNFVD
jgi:succinate dehydrogenase / fumarate reductase flavoprotein subunit/fumarate reductase flavoprotein subunit